MKDVGDWNISDPPRLLAFERLLFEFARPGTAVLTTPNREYNVTWEALAAGKFRHKVSSRKATKAQRGGFAITENELAQIVVDSCYHIHVRLGPGLLETVYSRILEYELKKRGLRVRREVPIPFRYDEIEFDEGFRADLIV